jgi:hypothetical protein
VRMVERGERARLALEAARRSGPARRASGTSFNATSRWTKRARRSGSCAKASGTSFSATSRRRRVSVAR